MMQHCIIESSLKERKKTMGGKYNEKFFITFKDESDEFEEGKTEVTEQ